MESGVLLEWRDYSVKRSLYRDVVIDVDMRLISHVWSGHMLDYLTKQSLQLDKHFPYTPPSRF